MSQLILIVCLLFLNQTMAQNTASKIKCSRTAVCGVGQCCRGSDGKVIPAAMYYFTDVDWWRAQIGLNPGNCSADLAQEGEFCDSFCHCSEGLLCTPNILCRSCSKICMTTEFVNKLVSYYDMGCNCIGNNGKETEPAFQPISLPYGLGNHVGNLGIRPPTFNNYPIFNNKNSPLKVVTSTTTRKNIYKSNIKIVDNIVQLPGFQ